MGLQDVHGHPPHGHVVNNARLDAKARDSGTDAVALGDRGQGYPAEIHRCELVWGQVVEASTKRTRYKVGWPHSMKLDLKHKCATNLRKRNR